MSTIPVWLRFLIWAIVGTLAVYIGLGLVWLGTVCWFFHDLASLRPHPTTGFDLLWPGYIGLLVFIAATLAWGVRLYRKRMAEHISQGHAAAKSLVSDWE